MSKKGKTNQGKNKNKNSNNNNNSNNENMTNTITGSSQTAGSSGLSASTPRDFASNRFETLNDDVGDETAGNTSFLNASLRVLPALPGEHPLPPIPVIPNIEMLNETQKKFWLMQVADSIKLRPETAAPAVPAPNTTSAAKLAAATSPQGANPAAEILAVSAKNGIPNRLGGGRDRSGSANRKRKAEENEDSSKRPRQQESNSGYKTETVFLSGIKDEIRKNGIIFKREFSRAVPGIKINNVFFTRSGSVGLTPATPRDVNALLAEDWSNHTHLGDSVKATPDRKKIIQHRAIITGVDPNEDDVTLKEELESQNNLKLTSIERLVHRESGTKIWKVKVGLENEESAKRVLKDGVYLGYTKHKCIPPFDRSTNRNDRTIGQCYKCQKWDPKHSNSNCQGVRACLWCAADHFHKECPLFQARDRDGAKCANCKGAHPAWSQSCPHYTEASQSSTRVTAAKVVSSSSTSKADLDAAVATNKAAIDSAMEVLWQCLASVLATAVTRSILDLRADEKRTAEAGTRVSTADLVMRIATDTVKTMNECRPLQVSTPIEAAEMQKTVWKSLFPQAEFPATSRASSTPQVNDKTNSSLSLK